MDKSERRKSGPCLVCDRETAYGPYGYYCLYDRYGNEWLDRQFAGKTRAEHIEAIEEGAASGFNRTRTALFDQFVCGGCKARLKIQWPDRYERRKAEAAKEQKRREQEQFRHTWRMPNPGEFPISSGRCEFLVRSFDRKPALLVFRWRTCMTKKCRGDVPAQSVGMWVRGRLCAHYHAWQFDGEADLFGPGIVFWIEKTFQSALAKMEPAAIWHARPRPDCRQEWDGIGTFHNCHWEEGIQPCIIHTLWPNGAVYAQLRNFTTVAEIVEFGWESLNVEIREQRASAVVG